MYLRKLVSFVSSLAVLMALTIAVNASTTHKDKSEQKKNERVVAPVNLAVLIQDDLISQVDNELAVTGDFIRSLPEGSRVMVGYITTGTLQIRQPFTTDLEKAAKSLRIPLASRTSSAFNPYVEVIEALKKFEDGGNNANALLLISDGLDTSRGF